MSKILIIERDTLFLQVLEECLTLHGFNLITAKRIDEGYKLADLEQPDLIFCGYGFPKFEILQLFQALQNDPETSTIPFLMMTGSYLEDIPNWQIHLKRGELFLKPFDSKTLVQTFYLKLPVLQT